MQVTADRGHAAEACETVGFREIFQQVRSAGLMERRPGYYSMKIGLTVGAMAAGWVALFFVGDSWLSLLIALYLGLAFTQVVFLGHDAGHQQIFSSRRANWVVGLAVGNLLTGLSFGWWVPKHCAHHGHPNQEDRDPDIGRGAIAFTAAHVGARRGFSAWAARHQAALLIPLMFLEALSLHVASAKSLYGRHPERSARRESLLFGLHVALYLGAVFWVLSPGRALAFIAVQQGVFGFYLGCAFAPNHKGMPIIERDSTLSFSPRQVLTARNVNGGRFVTFLLGGLDYQIEHHLFPTMPRPNLVHVQPFVRAFCASSGLPYSEDSLLGSYRSALLHLKVIGSGESPDPSVDDLLARQGRQTASVG